MSEEMKDQSSSITEEYVFNLHYHLYKNDKVVHYMNAYAKLDADKSMFEIISIVANQCNVQIKIDVQALEEGSLWQKVVLTLTTLVGLSYTPLGQFVLDITKFFITEHVFISPKDKSQIDLNNMKTNLYSELVKSLQNDADIDKAINTIELLENNDKAVNSRSKYYKAVTKEKQLTKIGFSFKEIDDTSVPKEKEVKRSEFPSFIIKEEIEEETSNYIILLEIYMYCLIKGFKDKWHGLHNGQKFVFEMKDLDFIQQSKNNRIILQPEIFVVVELQRTVNSQGTYDYAVIKVIEHSKNKENLLNKHKDSLSNIDLKKKKIITSKDDTLLLFPNQ